MKQELSNSILLAWITPILVAVAPILALLGFNIQFATISETLRALLLAVAGTFLLLLIAFWLFKDIAFASALTSLITFTFFAYGHLVAYLDDFIGQRYVNDFVSVTFAALILFTFVILRRNAKLADPTNQFFVIAASILILINIAGIGFFEFSQWRANRASADLSATEAGGNTGASRATAPDIYYIILDGHARSDVILDTVGYDNTFFTEQLTELGFFVAQCSQSNYWQTNFSLGSIFRMDYLSENEIVSEILPDWEFTPVIEFLREQGYKIINFKTRVTYNNTLGEDVLLARGRQSASLLGSTERSRFENLRFSNSLNDFEMVLVQSTWLASWLDLLSNYSEILPIATSVDPEEDVFFEHYVQTHFVMDELPNIPKLDFGGPKFVYAHIVSPHEPYVFAPNGDYLWLDRGENFVEGYRNNVEFLDTHFGAILEAIIENSSSPPIIILQGDHGINGLGASRVLPILNAYYFPGQGSEALYDSISPVNTFRLLLASYFDLPYEPLPDISYFRSEEGEPIREVELDCNT